ncbi:MAG: 4-hydroxythreonine-4-phosphate dehydrogenase PdxA [Dehalococcoidia bacterium]|nr:4-hydroxythreonine-4-phosphate dehydrogenase PdxA [Dehalococcoidia bacterium]
MGPQGGGLPGLLAPSARALGAPAALGGTVPMTGQRRRPLIAVTLGDPAGIGPEVVVKALAAAAKRRSRRPYIPVVIGSAAVVQNAVDLAQLKLHVRPIEAVGHAEGHPGVLDVLEMQNLDLKRAPPGRASAAAGAACMEWATKAAQLCLDRHVAAMVTAPINKQATRMGGFEDVGHQELLQRLSGAQDVATMLLTPGLRVVHLTTHRSLRRACEAVTRPHIVAKLRLTDGCFREWGFAHPRIAVAALNPHASDGSTIGDEEAREIEPAVAEAKKLGIDARGPYPADSVFNRAIAGEFDVVLALYHDQGHIPIKVHDFHHSASVNLGLPFLRTSVDHGTAYDIAWKGVADATSMEAALDLAVSLVTKGKLP